MDMFANAGYSIISWESVTTIARGEGFKTKCDDSAEFMPTNNQTYACILNGIKGDEKYFSARSARSLSGFPIITTSADASEWIFSLGPSLVDSGPGFFYPAFGKRSLGNELVVGIELDSWRSMCCTVTKDLVL